MNIGAIARQTGMEVATLRKWEARYGFPIAQRTASGRRIYGLHTVGQIQAVCRAMAAGERPGKAIKNLLSGLAISETSNDTALTSPAISLLLSSDTSGLRQWISDHWLAKAAANFVEEIAAPLAREVGDLWAKGELPVYAEHVFSEEMETVLRRVPSKKAGNDAQPRILLTALAGEKHTLGLRMAGAVLSECGETPLYLSADLPANEIAAAANHYRIAVVGVTASLSYRPKLLLASLKALRQQLPESTQLWAGGAGIGQLSHLPENTVQIANMQALTEQLASLPPPSQPNLRVQQP